VETVIVSRRRRFCRQSALSTGDVAVRSAIVRVLARWGDTAMHVMAIVRALSLSGVRQTAVETLG